MHPSEMTDEQLRLAIAEEVAEKKGYKVVARLSDDDLHFMGGDLVFNEPVPNYPGDNNAAMGLEDSIDRGEKASGYVTALEEIVTRDNPESTIFDLIHATARQRSEAWLIARRRNDA